MKTGGHIKPCKVGEVENHNERRPEYVERMKTSKHPLNFYPTLALRPNQNWKNQEREEYRDRSTRRPLKVAEVFHRMIGIYQEKDKRHRMPPLKERERFDPKTGKMKTIAGWSPIREMVVVIKPETKIEDFVPVKAWFAKHGVASMFLSLHFDEGHLDEQGKLKANNHAHMGLDFFDWETGKTVKLGPKKMKELQTVLADALGMERGEIKELTGAEHLNVVEQRIEAKKQQLMPRIMTLVKGSDKEALEAAQAIIEEDRQKAQRLLVGAESKYQKAERRLADVMERENAIDKIIENVRKETKAEVMVSIDQLKKDRSALLQDNQDKRKLLGEASHKMEAMIQRGKQANQQITSLQAQIEFLKKLPILQALIAIIHRVMNTIGHAFTPQEQHFIKTAIHADNHAEERQNAEVLWDFARKNGATSHQAWMNETHKQLMAIADNGWMDKVEQEQQGWRKGIKS